VRFPPLILKVDKVELRYFAPLFLKVDYMTFGFILSRHVNSETTNKYWNTCIKQLNLIYPETSIVIIDDNSSPEFLKADEEYKNITIVQSEYPRRGELLPYYYFYKNKYFDNAIIIHDSVFFQCNVLFNKLEQSQIKVLPLWHFNWGKNENNGNTTRLATVLKHNTKILELVGFNQQIVLGLNNNNNKWSGCFGVQSYINHHFLSFLQDKYQLFNLLQLVNNRQDRCCLERLFAIIFNIEYPILNKLKSLLGPINKYCKWGTTYDEHCEYMKKYGKSRIPIVKVWTGR
jgi:hypothetical protein